MRNAEMVATVSEFLTVGSSHTGIPNSKRLLLAGSLRFFTEEPAVRKALTAATSYPAFHRVGGRVSGTVLSVGGRVSGTGWEEGCQVPFFRGRKGVRYRSFR